MSSGWTGAGLGTNAGVDSEQDPRLLSSREFLRELGKGAGARKELSALSLRWINLRGLPHITAAFTYNKYALSPAPLHIFTDIAAFTCRQANTEVQLLCIGLQTLVPSPTMN
jgi:hypothetical protein